MTRPRHSRSARRGFTLVELMVACALVVLILTILAVAFGAASGSFSHLKSIGDMAERLRTAQTKLRVDLEAQHFETGDSPARLRLSDLNYHQIGLPGASVLTPKGGYFRIEQGSGSGYEGLDPDGLMSTNAFPRLTDSPANRGHALEFTVRRDGDSPDDLFTIQSNTLAADSETDTALGASQFSTRWARVRWQLGNPQTNSAGVTTYTLYRSVRLLAPAPPTTSLAATRQILIPSERELISTPAVAPFNPHTVQTITSPLTRVNSPINPYDQTLNPTHYGDDIVLTNVTSFEVKPTWDAGANVRSPRSGTVNSLQTTLNPTNPSTPIPDGSVGANRPNSEWPYDDLPTISTLPYSAVENNDPAYVGRRIFDTWTNATGWNTGQTTPSPTAIPLRIRVTALQIKVRVFDPKNLLSRQVTFIVPL